LRARVSIDGFCFNRRILLWCRLDHRELLPAQPRQELAHALVEMTYLCVGLRVSLWTVPDVGLWLFGGPCCSASGCRSSSCRSHETVSRLSCAAQMCKSPQRDSIRPASARLGSLMISQSLQRETELVEGMRRRQVRQGVDYDLSDHGHIRLGSA
jgi:hypothetical protein